jgi:hypothetical protein
VHSGVQTRLENASESYKLAFYEPAANELKRCDGCEQSASHGGGLFVLAILGVLGILGILGILHLLRVKTSTSG